MNIPNELTKEIISFDFKPIDSQTFVAPNLNELTIQQTSKSSTFIEIPLLPRINILKIITHDLFHHEPIIHFQENYNAPVNELSISHRATLSLPESIKQTLVKLSLHDTLIGFNNETFSALTHLHLSKISPNDIDEFFSFNSFPLLIHLTLITRILDHSFLSRSVTENIRHFECSCHKFTPQSLDLFPNLQSLKMTVKYMDKPRFANAEFPKNLKELTIVYDKPDVWPPPPQPLLSFVPQCMNNTNIISITFVDLFFNYIYIYPEGCKRLILNRVHMPNWPVFPSNLEVLHLLEVSIEANRQFIGSDLPVSLKELVLDVRKIQITKVLTLSHLSNLQKLSIICNELSELPTYMQDFITQQKNFGSTPMSLESIPYSLKRIEVRLLSSSPCPEQKIIKLHLNGTRDVRDNSFY